VEVVVLGPVAVLRRRALTAAIMVVEALAEELQPTVNCRVKAATARPASQSS
jgi:hypothetical protein